MAITAPRTVDVSFRAGRPGDALCVGVLAMQVFLDTYATEGIQPDLACEVLNEYMPQAFERRLSDEAQVFLLAERQGSLVAFAELALDNPCPVEASHGEAAEVVRLYVQSPFQAKGIGSVLLERLEDLAVRRGIFTLWLSAWAGNGRALAFYRARGYGDIGGVNHEIEGRTYENRVFIKKLRPTNAI